MNEYNSIDPYGTYQSKGLDPYEMLMKMSSWQNEIRSTLSQVDSDLGAVSSTVVQQADLIAQRVTYEDYTGENVTSMIVQDPYSINLLANQLNITGLVTIADLKGNGTTTINGANIITKTILADHLAVGSLSAISADLGLVTAGYIQGVVIEGATFISRAAYSYLEMSAGEVYTSVVEGYVAKLYGGSVIASYLEPTNNQHASSSLTSGGLAVRENRGGGNETLYNIDGIRSTTTFRFNGNVDFYNATVTGLTVPYAASAGNASTVQGLPANAFAQMYLGHQRGTTLELTSSSLIVRTPSGTTLTFRAD